MPATIEPCKRPIMFELTQTADLSHWQGEPTDKAWQAFLGDVRRFAGKPAPAEAVQPAPPAALPLPSKPSIAVMPFANLSGDPDQEYFADGMVLEITNALTRISSLFVIASSSTLTFKGKNVAAQDAARQLGVHYVLDGSVRKGGNRVRIAVQLIDAADGTQIWNQRFEDTLDDIFDLQDKVALAVAGRIEPTIQEAEVRRAHARPTENMGSYDLYLRAIASSASMSKAGFLAAQDLARRAVALDPDYAPALALLAVVNYQCELFGWADDPEANRREGLEMAQRALKAGRDDAQVLAGVAVSLFQFTGDQVTTKALVARATDLNPGSARVWSSRGLLLMRTGEAALAVEAVATALRLDPISPRRVAMTGNLGQALFLQGRFAEALAPLREAAQQTELPAYQLFLAAALGHLGDTLAAAAALAAYHRLTSRPIEAIVRSSYTPEASVTLILAGVALAAGTSADNTAP